MKRTGSWKLVALLGVALSSSACYRYTPAQLEAIPPGEGVRVLVTSQGATELAQVTEVGETAPIVDGEVVGVEGQELLLSVPVGRSQDGFMVTSVNQTVRIPTGEIVSFQRRELDKAATVLVIGGAAGVVSAIVAFVLNPLGSGSNDPPDLPDDFGMSFSLWSLPIGQ